MISANGGFLSVLNKLWRILMTGLCFAGFGIGGLFLSLVWFNILLLCIRDRNQRKRVARQSISYAFRFFFYFMRWVRVLDHQVAGFEGLQNVQRLILVANHPTLLDYVLLAAYIPQLDCAVKGDLLRNPFLCGVVKAADYLPNSEEPEVFLQRCEERLAQGEVILIFPEGTRTREKLPVKLQRGAANMAIRCNCSLQLIKIWCTPPIVTKELKWYEVSERKATLYAQVCERIEIDTFLDGLDANDRSMALAARRLTGLLLQRLSAFKVCTFGRR